MYGNYVNVNTLLLRPKCRWQVSIKMELKKIACSGKDWIQLVQDRVRWRVLI